MTQLAIAWSTDDKGHRAALLDLLRDFNWHSHAECTRVGGSRFGARLLELRRQGWPVVTERVAQGVYRYRLLQAAASAPVGRVTLADLYAVDRLFRGAL